MRENVIETMNLHKEYPGGKIALEDVSLSVQRGGIFGLLGPNGAGKTTMLSILTTLLRKTSGEVFIDGIDVSREPERVRKRIGLVFQNSTNDSELTGRENLEYIAGLYGVPSRDAKSRIDELLDEMNLLESADKFVKEYSGGMKRKLEIAAAIIHNPEIIFLDEPTLGLDPSSRSDFWAYIRKIREKFHTTIFMNTHYLEEADQLCDQIAILDQGRIIASGSPSSLKAESSEDLIEIVTSARENDLADVLGDRRGILEFRKGENSMLMRCENSGRVIPEIVLACKDAGIEIGSLVVHKPSLEQVFLKLTGHKFDSASSPPGVSWQGRRDN